LIGTYESSGLKFKIVSFIKFKKFHVQNFIVLDVHGMVETVFQTKFIKTPRQALLVCRRVTTIHFVARDLCPGLREKVTPWRCNVFFFSKAPRLLHEKWP
jgi:hypothetical protein